MPPQELRIEIIGAGVVGTATGKAFYEKGHTPIFKDVRQEPIDRLTAEGHETAWDDEHVEADISMFCVPTPWDDENRRYVMDYVYDAMDSFTDHTDPNSRVIAIHSTSLPGTTDEIIEQYDLDHAAMVPELLRQRQALSDALANLDSIIIGTESDHAEDVIKQAYHWKENYVRVTPTEAELAKFTSNWYAATKISFANEIWRISQDLDCEPRRVEEAFQRASPWAEFGEDGLRGGWPYDGACLPKDTKGLQQYFRELGLDVPQLDGTIGENELMRNHEKTIEPEVSTGE